MSQIVAIWIVAKEELSKLLVAMSVSLLVGEGRRAILNIKVKPRAPDNEGKIIFWHMTLIGIVRTQLDNVRARDPGDLPWDNKRQAFRFSLRDHLSSTILLF